MASAYLCAQCGLTFRRGDGTHCPDCGECGETIGHMGCQYPQDHHEDDGLDMPSYGA